MSTYETLRHFADSYGLIAMGFLYAALCFWALRPGAKEANEAAAHSIFREAEHGE